MLSLVVTSCHSVVCVTEGSESFIIKLPSSHASLENKTPIRASTFSKLDISLDLDSDEDVGKMLIILVTGPW